jgi:hypothetical protein
MTTGRRLVFVFAAFGLVLLLLAGGSAFFLHVGPFARAETPAPQPLPQDLGPVIATVNGQPIYLGEAQSRMQGLSTVHGDASSMLGKDWPDKILQSLVSDQIIRAEAKSQGISASQADMQEWLGQIRSMLGEGQTLEGWLAEQGITYQELLRRIELQVIAARVYNAVTTDVNVRGEEIRRYYRAHRSEFEGVDGHVASLLEVRNSLRESMLKQKQDETYAAWLEEEKGKANVEIVMNDWWRNLS